MSPSEIQVILQFSAILLSCRFVNISPVRWENKKENILDFWYCQKIVGGLLPIVYCALLCSVSDWLTQQSLMLLFVSSCCVWAPLKGDYLWVWGVRGVMSHITCDASPHHPCHVIILTSIIANFRHFHRDFLWIFVDTQDNVQCVNILNTFWLELKEYLWLSMLKQTCLFVWLISSRGI